MQIRWKSGTAILAMVVAAMACAGVLAPPQAASAEPAPGTVEGDAAKHLVGMLGSQFVVFLPPVQEELKLSPEQKQHLQQAREGATQGVKEFMQNIGGLQAEEQEKKVQEFREVANKNVSMMLSQLLKPEQQKRLRQIVLQREGLFALGNPDVASEVKLTEEQRGKIATLLLETKERFDALQEKARNGGKPEELAMEAPTIRKEQEQKIDALLTDEQRGRWKELLGTPLALGE